MGSRPDGTSERGVFLPLAKPHETMSVLARPRPVVEISLLRQSVGALAERRTCCDHCRRTPLVGERVYLYAQAIVCELCRPRRRGAPERSELVRSPEHKRAVRVRPRSVR